MHKDTSSSPQQPGIPAFLQKAFIVTLAAIILAQATQTLWMFSETGGYGNHFEPPAVLSSLASSVGVPLVFFIGAYCLYPRSNSLLSRIFGSALLATMAQFIVGILDLYVLTVIEPSTSYNMHIWSIRVALLAVAGGGLVYLRFSGRWK